MPTSTRHTFPSHSQLQPRICNVGSSRWWVVRHPAHKTRDWAARWQQQGE
jgi:hypothetical protein